MCPFLESSVENVSLWGSNIGLRKFRAHNCCNKKATRAANLRQCYLGIYFATDTVDLQYPPIAKGSYHYPWTLMRGSSWRIFSRKLNKLTSSVNCTLGLQTLLYAKLAHYCFPVQVKQTILLTAEAFERGYKAVWSYAYQSAHSRIVRRHWVISMHLDNAVDCMGDGIAAWSALNDAVF